jgi:catechol 2,3-dioxygenase-like lactoylglutathione lyase family enzyme
MKIVPVIKSGDLERSVQFYTRVLDFERKWPGNEDREISNGVIDLIRDGAEFTALASCRGRCVRFGQPRVCGRRERALYDLSHTWARHDIASRVSNSHCAG